MEFHTLPAFLDHWADTRGDKVWMRELKEEGNKFFRAAQYLKAAAAYTKAIKLAGADGSAE